MLLSHATTLARARSHVAALADRAQTVEAALEYEWVLLQLDALHGDDVPGIETMPMQARHLVFGIAESAIEELVAHGADELQISLVLDALDTARSLDLR